MLKEEPLNAYLAEILGESHTLLADPEVTLPDGRMDVRCVVGNNIVGIEAKLGTRPAQQRAAIADANRRLVNGHCDIAVALLYPSGLYRRPGDLRAGEVRVNVRSKAFPFDDRVELQLQTKKARWDTVPVASMSDYLDNVPSEASSPEVLASMADVAIEAAFNAFTPVERASILANMKMTVARDPDKALKGLLTDLMTAVMFQSKLDVIRHRIDAPSPDWSPPRVIECINSSNLQESLRLAHQQWIKVDYMQILEWSCAILEAMPSTSTTRSALSRIALTARDIEQSTGGEHHDLFGITFCQSVESAKNDGSMYTTVPAATLLTRLAFSEIEKRIDWSDYDDVTDLRVVDFACGTGTLLIATANYMLGRQRTDRPDDVAREMLEQVLYGFDINDRAIFQSATGLGMISPSVAFRKMHLYSMLLGLDESGSASLGSLELLDGLTQGSFNPRRVGARVEAQPAPIEAKTFDVAVMNPPFTVQDKRHQQFPQRVKTALKHRESQLIKGTAVHRSGNSGAFVLLADRHLDEDHGVLTFILPTASANAPSGKSMRVWLAERFQIKYLVVSYDPRRIYFSGNTNLGEMMVIASRYRERNEPEPTIAVKLTDNPPTASSAVAISRYIVEGTAEDYGCAMLDSIQHDAIAQGDWSALQFADAKLYRAAAGLVDAWGSTLGEQFEIRDIGAPVSIHGNRLTANEAGAVPVLWEHNAQHCNKLMVEPDSWVLPKDGHERDLERHMTRLHRLKVPERLSLTSSVATAVLTAEPSLSMSWQNVVPKADGGVHARDAEKAAAMILNSSLGKLAMLLVRNNRKPSYPHFSITAQRNIPMPSLESIGVDQVRRLATVFDELATVERKPFPQAHTCRVQLQVDKEVCEVVGYDLRECKDLRDRLAREPMISNRPYGQPVEPAAV